MAIEEKTEHIAEAQANLLEQFKDKTNFDATLKAFVQQIQETEEAGFQLLNDRYLGTAVGEQLDGIGQIVGEERKGRSDADYEIGIRARIQLNVSEGTIEDIIGLVIALAGDAITVRIIEDFPAAFEVITNDPIDAATAILIAQFIDEGRGAAIKKIFTYGTTGAFTFDSGPGFDIGKLGNSL